MAKAGGSILTVARFLCRHGGALPEWAFTNPHTPTNASSCSTTERPHLRPHTDRGEWDTL